MSSNKMFPHFATLCFFRLNGLFLTSQCFAYALLRFTYNNYFVKVRIKSCFGPRLPVLVFFFITEGDGPTSCGKGASFGPYKYIWRHPQVSWKISSDVTWTAVGCLAYVLLAFCVETYRNVVSATSIICRNVLYTQVCPPQKHLLKLGLNI